MAEDKKVDRVTLIVNRIRDAYDEMDEWLRLAAKTRKYYHSKQWDDMDLWSSRRRLQITANVIRRDIDSMRARILDADPIMDTQGRGAEDFKLGDVWADVIKWSEEWTGRKYDSCREVRERLLTDFFVVGEGFEKIGWDDSEEDGLGMVVSEHVPASFLVWDRDARSVQRRDAKWITEFTPVLLTDLEEEFPEFKGRMVADYPDLLLSGAEKTRYDEYVASVSAYQGADIQRQDQRKAYRIECWEKRQKWEYRFFLEGRPALVREDGEDVPMRREHFQQLAKSNQDDYREVRVKRQELWVTTIAGGQKIKEELSIYDESNKGHGEYPYAFYSNVWDADQTHAHGEVEYLLGLQDVINQSTSRYLESLFVSVQQALFYFQGSMPAGEQAKLDLIGKRPMQKIALYPGQQPPAYVGANPAAAQLFQAAIPFLSDLKDKVSGISDVNRAAPRYDLSGKAVRALQSEADLPQVIARLHIESGMRQATMLRLAVIMQMMRANRIIRITPKAEKAGYTIFMGQDEEGVKSLFNLRPETTKQQLAAGEFEVPTGMMVDRDGNTGQVLEINDASIRKFDLRFKLDTGREANKEERGDLAQAMMQFLGPALGAEALRELALWAARLMDVPDVQGLEDGLAKGAQGDQAVQTLAQLQKDTGLPIEQMAQLAMQMQQLMKAAGGGPGTAAAVGPGNGRPSILGPVAQGV